ncbi:MAG: hypothetical protein ABSG56_37220 [Bryobacteraceae bacterium]|jgi:hypothetical protein
MRKFLFSILFMVLVVASMSMSFGKDKPAYEIGIFQASLQASDGNYSSGNGGFSESHNVGHNVHLLSTPEGLYYIDAPTNVGLSVLSSMATNGHSAAAHKQWFMDDLHEGDKVLFSAACDKHWNCRIRLPNPENPEKVIATNGHFKPASAKTNTTNALCGTGKLTPDAEAQLCPEAPPAPIEPPAPPPDPKQP